MAKKAPKPLEPKPVIFRVIREKVGDETVRILLEPYRNDQVVSASDGDEFVTGTLNSDPWEVKD